MAWGCLLDSDGVCRGGVMDKSPHYIKMCESASYFEKYDSMEKLGLAFVMPEKYNKKLK